MKSAKHVGIGLFAVLWAAGLAVVLLGNPFDGGERVRASTPPPEERASAFTPKPPPDEPEAYRPLPRPRPTLSETEPGVPSAPAEEEDVPDEAEDPARPESDEQIRQELGQLREYYRSLPSFLSPSRESGRFQVDPADLELLGGWRRSVSSVYFDYGGPLACGGRLRRDQFGVAHKTLPCGTMVTFRYGNRALRVPVIDRGPYIRGREWDLTGATALALGFPGLGQIEWTLE